MSYSVLRRLPIIYSSFSKLLDREIRGFICRTWFYLKTKLAVLFNQSVKLVEVVRPGHLLRRNRKAYNQSSDYKSHEDA